MTRAESAAANMIAHKMNCSQCVLTAFCEELGLDAGLARKIALGFGHRRFASLIQAKENVAKMGDYERKNLHLRNF